MYTEVLRTQIFPSFFLCIFFPKERLNHLSLVIRFCTKAHISLMSIVKKLSILSQSNYHIFPLNMQSSLGLFLAQCNVQTHIIFTGYCHFLLCLKNTFFTSTFYFIKILFATAVFFSCCESEFHYYTLFNFKQRFTFWHCYKVNFMFKLLNIQQKF